MIDVPGGLVWDLPCVQQASYLERGPLMWMLPLYLQVNQKSDYGDGMIYSVYNGLILYIYEKRHKAKLDQPTDRNQNYRQNENIKSLSPILWKVSSGSWT